MAVKYLAVIYRDGVEIDRWPAVETYPNVKFWGSFDILMMKTGSNTYWARAGTEFWRNLPEDDVPKPLRLLALLE